jgi:hypothetical protein
MPVKNVSLLTALVILTISGLLAFIVIPQLSAPMFRVSNLSSAPVRVTARWRDNQKPLGVIDAAASITFDLNDEAAILFQAQFPDGKMITSSEIYFTAGITVQADITATAIVVGYQPDS